MSSQICPVAQLPFTAIDVFLEVNTHRCFNIGHEVVDVADLFFSESEVREQLLVSAYRKRIGHPVIDKPSVIIQRDEQVVKIL